MKLEQAIFVHGIHAQFAQLHIVKDVNTSHICSAHFGLTEIHDFILLSSHCLRRLIRLPVALHPSHSQYLLKFPTCLLTRDAEAEAVEAALKSTASASLLLSCICTFSVSMSFMGTSTHFSGSK